MFRKRHQGRMRVYHGSNQIVEKPRILEPKHTTDFGRGFYTTESEKQAEEWAVKIKGRRKTAHAYVSEYEYEGSDDIVVIIFDGPTEEWFDFVHSNRVDNIEHDYDIIIGPVADDSVYETIFSYEAGLLTKEQAITALKAAELDGQVLFHTDKSLECLRYLGYKEVR